MLRISVISESDRAVEFQLEGKLVGPWVDELRKLGNQALSQQKTVSLDLGRVWFVDGQGVALLKDFARRQVSELNCSPFLRQQLQEAAQ